MSIRKGLVYAAVAAILWATVNPFIKYGLGCGITPMNFAGLRFTAAGIILLSFTAHRGMLREIWTNRRLFLNLVLINMFIGYSVFYAGIDMTGADISSIVMGLSPLVNVLLAHFIVHDDRLTAARITSLVVSLAGLLLIIGAGGRGGTMLDWRSIAGIGLLFVNIIAQGYSAICVARSKAKLDPVFMNGVQMFLGGMSIYGAGLAFEGFTPLCGMPPGFFVVLGILVIISVFAFSLWFKALKMPSVKYSELNMCRLATPVVGAAISWLIIEGERPTFSSVSGMIVIIAALVIYFRSSGRSRRA